MASDHPMANSTATVVISFYRENAPHETSTIELQMSPVFFLSLIFTQQGDLKKYTLNNFPCALPRGLISLGVCSVGLYALAYARHSVNDMPQLQVVCDMSTKWDECIDGFL